MIPASGQETSSYVYKANLFRPDKGTRTNQKWKLAWETTGPKFMHTAEEKAKQKRKQASKLKVSPKLRQALHKGLAKAKVQSKRSKAVQASKPPALTKAAPADKPATQSKFAALLQSWETTAKKQAAGEVFEKPKTPHDASRALLQSFLRPANIVGGGFGRTSSGMLPRFVKDYWAIAA